MTGRLGREEGGVALGLAVIVVALVGVLAAGLLASIAADLDALMQVNRGRQASELAEAGIEVAKAHLADDPGTAYWSSGELGMEGVGENTVVVTVEHDERRSLFVATSTGEYGGTRRRVEAVFSVEQGKPELVGWRELYE